MEPWQRLRNTLGSRRLDHELDEEIRFHLKKVEPSTGAAASRRMRALLPARRAAGVDSLIAVRGDYEPP